jgi:hypothetical protein
LPDWHYAQKSAGEELCQLSFYAVKKREGDREIEFRITVREFVERPAGQHSRFFAEADQHVNRGTAPILPCGWGTSELEALAGCTQMIRQFPFEE